MLSAFCSLPGLKYTADMRKHSLQKHTISTMRKSGDKYDFFVYIFRFLIDIHMERHHAYH